MKIFSLHDLFGYFSCVDGWSLGNFLFYVEIRHSFALKIISFVCCVVFFLFFFSILNCSLFYLSNSSVHRLHHCLIFCVLISIKTVFSQFRNSKTRERKLRKEHRSTFEQQLKAILLPQFQTKLNSFRFVVVSSCVVFCCCCWCSWFTFILWKRKRTQ